MNLTVKMLREAKELLDREQVYEPFTAECGHEVNGQPYSYYVSPYTHKITCSSCVQIEIERNNS